MIVYELTHIFHRYNHHLIEETAGLGYYASMDSIRQAVPYYITQPGFCDNPEAFAVRQREVKGAVENRTFFEAMVYFHTEDYEYEHTFELGLFGSEAQAQEAVAVFCRENSVLFNFRELIAEEIVNRCILDRREWAEGFTLD